LAQAGKPCFIFPKLLYPRIAVEWLHGGAEG